MPLEHVETITASSQSSVDFTNSFASDDGADRYIIFVDNWVPANDNRTLEARVSSDGGSNWDSGSSDYAWSKHSVEEDGSSGGSGSGGNTEIRFVGENVSSSSSSNDTGVVMATVHEPTNSNRGTLIRSKSAGHSNNLSNSFRVAMSGGERLTQSSVDSIRLFAQSGNISSGIFSVYRVVQSGTDAMSHIQTINASSQSTADFTNVFASDDGNDMYLLYVDNFIPSTDTNLQVRYSTDGGTNWDSGSSDYARSQFEVNEAGGTTGGGSASDDSIFVTRAGVSSDASSNNTSSLQIVMSDPTDSNRATIQRTSNSLFRSDITNSFNIEYGGGIRLTQSAVDSIQFLTGAGQISSGIFSVYGV